MRLRTLWPFLAALCMFPTICDAQNAPALAGRWEGTLIPSIARGSRGLSERANRPRLPTVVIIETAGDGTHSGTWASTSQNGITSIGDVTIEDGRIRIPVPLWRGVWEGTLSADGTALDGIWTQNGLKSPLVLKKAAAR